MVRFERERVLRSGLPEQQQLTEEKQEL